MSRTSRILFLSCLILALNIQAASAQTPSTAAPDPFVQQHKELPPVPEDLTFKLRLIDDKAQFHPGEVIRLELSFASTQPGKYGLDSAGYDRSGRLDMDTFVLDRSEGTVDPLHDYYSSGLFFFMGGGLRGMPTLEKKPELINYDLNEWLRFDQPGKYRLYVISPRAFQGKPYHQGNKPLSLASNIVEFEILPANEPWQAQALRTALKVLDAATTKEEERRKACRALRFLGTDEAIKESIQRFRGQDPNCDFEYDFGLLGTSRRQFTVARMEAALDAPEQPVTSQFVTVLSFLSYLVENPKPLNAYPANNEAEAKAWQLQMAERRKVYDGIVQKYVGRLAIAVKQKQSAASAVSLETLINFQTSGNSQLDEPQRKELAASLAKVFLDLPRETQRNLLEYRWKQIAHPALLPVLRQLYQQPPDMHISPAPFPGLALQRLYELAPDEGRQLILDEIRRPKLRVRLAVLGSLPDKELPQLEDTIVERAIDADGEYREQEIAVALVDRYVSGASLPRLRVAFEPKIGTLACAVQQSLISYFLRNDQAFGLEMLKKALSSRKQTGCYASALTSAARENISPEFEALALELLDDKDEAVMAETIKVLAKYGAASNKAKVKARIKQQLEQWREEKKDPESSISATNSVQLGYFAEGLLYDYAHALAWLTEKDELKELESLCLNKQCRDQAEAWANSRGGELWFYNSVTDDDKPTFAVEHYDQLSWAELKRKLVQFPKDTTFTWIPERAGQGQEDKLFTELKEYLEGLGMKLVRRNEVNN